MTSPPSSPFPAATQPGPRSALDLRGHLTALRRFWLSTALCAVAGVLAAVAVTSATQPTYETRTTFFLVTSTGTNTSPVQADEFAQRRINSYVGVVRSGYMAAEVIEDTGLPVTPEEVQQMISTSVDPETVLMNVTVTDISPDRSLIIGRSIADRLDASIGSLENRGSRGTIRLRVISGPTLNPDPVSPREKLNLALGLLLGLGAGIAQALLRYQLDDSLRTRDDLAGAGFPVLGTLYRDRGLNKAKVLDPRASRSLLGEAVRQLRTNLRFVSVGRPVAVLAVTSSVGGEGKSVTAVYLAQSFAELGRRVLLIDADLREPRLGRLLGLAGSAGLSSVLVGETTLEDAVQPWGAHALQVLPGGLVPPNPSELLAGSAMTALVTTARSRYDLVVLDTSALLPVTDGAVAASQADGAILLVRHGQTSRDEVGRSIESLQSVDARLLGTVLSIAPATRAERRAAGKERGQPWPAPASVEPTPAVPSLVPSGATVGSALSSAPAEPAEPAEPGAVSAVPPPAEVVVSNGSSVRSTSLPSARSEPTVATEAELEVDGDPTTMVPNEVAEREIKLEVDGDPTIGPAMEPEPQAEPEVDGEPTTIVNVSTELEAPVPPARPSRTAER